MSIRTRLAALAAASITVAVLLPGQATAAPDTTPPTAPSNLRVTSLSFTTVGLAWNPGTDNSGWVQYVVEVRTPPHYVQRYGALGTTKAFSALAQGTTYTATVWTRDGANNQSAGVSIQFTTPVDTHAPAAPGNLRATTEAIMWDAAVDDSEQLTYFLWSGPELILVTYDLGMTIFEMVYIQCLVQTGTIHTFTVQALDVGGNWSPHSNAITVAFPT